MNQLCPDFLDSGYASGNCAQDLHGVGSVSKTSVSLLNAAAGVLLSYMCGVLPFCHDLGWLAQHMQSAQERHTFTCMYISYDNMITIQYTHSESSLPGCT